ncbi:hypothetical protein L3556_07215 [Candidatus Synechococcus calcipolaris G9]|uniref:Uncharacterized protein n=1 Tax=Candidatus Synechococcus calcipolaris G9 TaxID=1497997 RepID=A0ABT6EYB0_9SYNE|nr:hypothetical protein [Candidatus Synechococcus calcipolaris]MDG2990722.1 hypothetical protein [Candidatus Synechococcus calcipolaris G9]
MNLQEQANRLIADAPQDGQTPQAIRTIAPILVAQAQMFPQLIYYVLQTPNQQWQVVTLEHRRHPGQTKSVIYAYGSEAMALSHGGGGLGACPIPIIDLLFQLLAMEPVDSLLILEDGATENSSEVSRAQLQQKIIQALTLPPNLA